MSVRCENTDLLTSECAHCTGATLPGDPGELTIAYRFAAGYAGQCAHCESWFSQGAQVGRTDDRLIVCPACVRQATA